MIFYKKLNYMNLIIVLSNEVINKFHNYEN